MTISGVSRMRDSSHFHPSMVVTLTFPLYCDFCPLLITFANSLEPDQDRQNVGPDLGLKCLTLIVFPKEFFEKVNFEKVSRRYIESMQYYPSC